MAAGIDDIAMYIPRLYVDAADFANARGVDPAKLVKGLGISQMAMVDTNQDPACLAANACLQSRFLPRAILPLADGPDSPPPSLEGCCCC